tara:strand:+ start:501 stop:1733 length:1233 start_codon:yes stop_codon:yes gene_type:complete
MAKKQSNIGMFERAGYALGASKTRTRGIDYLGQVAKTMEDVNRIDEAFKTQKLLKENPNGVEIPKFSEAMNDQISEFLLSQKDEIANAHKLMKRGNQQERDEATRYINDIEKSIQQLNKDFEGAALKRKNLLDVKSRGTYAVSNTNEQALNFQKYINGSFGDEGVIQVVDGMPRLTYNGQVWDTIDTGDEYSFEIEDGVEDMLTRIEDLGLRGKPWNRDNSLRDLRKLTRDPKAIKDYVFQNRELLDEVIAIESGIPIKINGENNPNWDNFEGGVVGESEYDHDDYVRMLRNQEPSFFSDNFAETVMNMFDKGYKKNLPQEEVKTSKTQTQASLLAPETDVSDTEEFGGGFARGNTQMQANFGDNKESIINEIRNNPEKYDISELTMNQLDTLSLERLQGLIEPVDKSRL